MFAIKPRNNAHYLDGSVTCGYDYIVQLGERQDECNKGHNRFCDVLE